ncbi:MAG: hypothetical protein GX144_09055 [Clostridiaceae bacterium]|jgi:hypothetical protein|nr:hypothetical protein [Clostridiaceae bacterium]
MNTLELAGTLLGEAKEVLKKKGITNIKVVFTGPPRVTDRAVRDDFRVILVYWDRSPIEVLVCEEGGAVSPYGP